MKRSSSLPLALLLLATLVVVAPACGKRGPPLPPLRPSPEFVTALDLTRRGDVVLFSFSPPVKNSDGSEPVAFDHADIYAMTMPVGGITPTAAQLLLVEHRVASLRPPDAPTPAADAAPPTEPTPPIVLTFSENLSLLKVPAALPLAAPAPAVATPLAPVAAPPGVPAAERLKVATRFYLVVPFANRSRAGYATEVLAVPLAPPPTAPTDLVATFDEQSITLKWTAGSAESFRVFEQGTPAEKVLTRTAIKDSTFSMPVVFGKEICFVVRSVTGASPVFIDSAPTTPACVTPMDVFPPPAPANLLALATESVITLTWDAVSAPDLGGYIVLRGEGSSERLQPLMTAPVSGTSFEDKTTKVGVKYVYAVVAVDKATPANRSKESNRVEETGR